MRRLTKKDVFKILNSRFKEGFVKLSSIPQPNTLKDMQKAAKRIAQAVKKEEKILVVGDYDVDGVVSTALMKEFFNLIGYDAQFKIPNRFIDGYGLNIDLIKDSGADVVITVDNGISAIEAAAYCKANGIDLIITDHHTPSNTLPDAYAIINPKQKECNFAYPDICGAQVAWLLIAQLKKEMGLNINMKDFLDLLTLAIIADVMPLRHINRALVQAGLKAFEQSSRASVRFLRDVLKKSEFKSDDIAFGVAPLINSAGRMEDATLALKFLLAKDYLEASVYYARLLSLNTQRKEEEKRVYEESLKFIGDERVILSVGEDWNEGVVGIVASRIAEKFNKPTIILTKSNKGYYKGSARSVADIDLFELINSSKEYLLRFGGHKKAAGLALTKENIQPFKKKINEYAKKLPAKQFVSGEDVLGELPFSQIDWELIDILDYFAPYGEANPMPRFAAFDVEVKEFRRVGENGAHLLLTLEQESKVFRAIMFRSDFEITKNRVDIIYYPSKNIFNNSVNIQLFLSKIS